MEGICEENKSVGIVFDLSLRHTFNGRRLIDVVKKCFIDLIKHNFENDVDTLYVYSAENAESKSKHGEQYHLISNYDFDIDFNLSYALRQTLYLLVSEDMTYRKYMIITTDRHNKSGLYEKILKINDRNFLDCYFIFIGIGDDYNKDVFNELSLKENVSYIHLENDEKLENNLVELFNGNS